MAAESSSPRKKVVPLLEDESDLVESMRQEMMKFEIPDVGGHLVEPLTDDRLLRYLRGCKFDVSQAAQVYKRSVEYRVSRLGPGPVSSSSSSVLSYVEGAEDDAKRPRVLLRLCDLDLSDDCFEERYAASLWLAIESALNSGKVAQTEGIVIVVDAREAEPRKHLRPRRLRFLARTVSTPARVARIEIFGASWLTFSITRHFFIAQSDVEVTRVFLESLPKPLIRKVTSSSS